MHLLQGLHNKKRGNLINHQNQNSVIAFDWGNTLMVELPQYSGMMAEWPEVAAVVGAQAALAELSERFHLIIASNAVDSNADRVRDALRRVGLDTYIKEIFTSHEVEGKKPQRKYFQSIQSRLPINAEYILVGDNYSTDIVGAWQAGWLAVWYNPSGAAAPGLLPLHDIEIQHLQDLPAALAAPRLPGWNQTQAWLTEQQAPANLILHVQSVANIAYQLAIWLRAAGEKVDPLLAQRGGMLHDLAKVNSLKKTSINHGEAAARILAEYGQPALAEIARRHILTNLLDESLAPHTWEEKVVYLADKLSEGSRLVTLDQRINALSQRYNRFSAGIQSCLPALHKLQREICTHIHIPEGELTDRLQSALLGRG